MRSIRRFTKAELLCQISQRWMGKLLAHFRTELAACAFVVPSEGDQIDIATLAKTLQSRDSNVPVGLVDALWHVHELRHEVDAVQACAIASGLDRGELLGMSVEDMVVFLFLSAPTSLLRLHAERAAGVPRTFNGFRAERSAELFCEGPLGGRTEALGKAIDEVLAVYSRGARVSTFSSSTSSEIEVVFGFGGTLARVASATAEAVSAVTFRPLEHVVIRIEEQSQLLSVATRYKWLERAIRKAVGRIFFGEPDWFGSDAPLYTLAPLLQDGSHALVCTDIPGLRKVTLVQLTYSLPSNSGHVRTDRASDLRDLLGQLKDEGVHVQDLISAKFKILVQGSSTPRSVVVHRGSRATFKRDDDQHLVEQFLRGRGFVLGVRRERRKSA